MSYVATAVFVIAMGFWLFAVVSWIRALRRRAPGVTLGSLLFSGFKSLSASSYSAEGRVHFRRFIAGALGFLLCAMIAIVLGAVAGSVG